MSKENAGSSNGVGFVGLLQLLFITLKLLNKISWSWLWVLSPIWICAALFLMIFIVLLLTALSEG
ncbi:hypothetical protein [Tepidibacter mesophilus]|uniref:hypothetical protein n=1 Tax=Tepidibacter mesophilus TaxID=655607 RepID=UPI000C072080|nr:hypothetical protein [Tepidibacter mesophilus]